MKNTKEVRCLMQQIAFHKMGKDDLLDFLMDLSWLDPLSSLWIVDLIQNVAQMTDIEFEMFLDQTLSSEKRQLSKYSAGKENYD